MGSPRNASGMDLNVITRSPEKTTAPAPLLFVHGAWHGAWCWDEHFLPYFASRGWESHAFDLRGHGDSPGRDRLRSFSIADFVEDLSTVVGSLQRSPVLVGHSMGGLVVQRYLEQATAPAAVLMASVPPRGAWRATFHALRRHPGAFARVNLTMNLGPLVATPQLARDFLFSDSTENTDVAKHHARLQDESYKAYLAMLLRWPRPHRVESPVLVLGAADDQIFYPSEIEATAVAYRSSAEVFPAMGHDMMLEAGWEQVAEHIDGWLQGIL
jgi:pimeloyl-ACP methyl ester carboxylesterase